MHIHDERHPSDVAVVVDVPAAQPSRVRWGALFAGLLVIMAIGSVLSILGSALGMSIADASDDAGVAKGVGIGFIIWTAFSWWIAYFLGSFMMVRMTRTLDRETAGLQGVTLWALGASVAFLLGALGIAGLTVGAATAVGTVVKGASAAAGAAGAAAAGNDSPYSVDVTHGAMAAIKKEAARLAENAGAAGGEEVNGERIRQAMENLDAETSTAIAIELVMGRPESAKDLLTARTGLREREVDAIVTGADKAVQEKVAVAKQKLEKAKEASLKYAQGVLWTTVIGALVALGAAVVGGFAGVASYRTKHVLSTRPATIAAM